MNTDVIIAGFGGQGVLLIGKMLARAGMHEGKHVCWLPSYGPEMRGGTANCTVVISDNPIGSPLVTRPRAIVVLNLPSLDKFEPQVRPQGLIIVNTSLIHRPLRRTDVTSVEIAANDIATSLESPRSANIVALGAYVGATHVISRASLCQSIQDAWVDKPDAVKANLSAVERGYTLGEAALASPGFFHERN